MPMRTIRVHGGGGDHQNRMNNMYYLLFLAVTFYAPKHTFIKVDYNRLTATVSFINPFLNIILSTDKITWKKYTYMYI